MRALSPLRLRRLLAVAKTRPVARVLLGLVAAFVCGVALGVGVAAMFAPERAGPAARVAGVAGQGAGKQTDSEQPYAVEVKVRKEGQEGERTAMPPAVGSDEKAAQGAVPAASSVSAEAPGGTIATKPAASPQSEAAAADLSGALPPPATAAGRPAAATPPVAAAPLVETPGPAAEALVPQIEALAPPIEAPGTVGGVPLLQNPADADNQLALGAPGLNGGVLPEAAERSPAPGAAAPPSPRPAQKDLTLAMLPMPGDAAWIRNAVKLPAAPRDVAVAIIIDDMGIDQKRSKLVIGLPAPLTLSFIPYGYHLKELVAAARAAGHEIMLHLPMEPMDPDADPGPNALRTTVSIEENQRRIEWALTRFDGFVGLNNHMGSKFTAWKPGMELVMREVQARGLLFVDSFTNNESVGYTLARQHKLPTTSRDVFIDHDITRAAIEHSLKELERIARRRGYAVGIAHPHDLSREMLKVWIKEAKSRGVDFVPISHIVQRAMKTG
jgi:polysaccharide deacetylase 2 family uncharacterized protein YibQ